MTTNEHEKYLDRLNKQDAYIRDQSRLIALQIGREIEHDKIVADLKRQIAEGVDLFRGQDNYIIQLKKKITLMELYGQFHENDMELIDKQVHEGK